MEDLEPLVRSFKVMLKLTELAIKADERATLSELRAVQAEKARDEQYHRAEDLQSKLEWSQQEARVRAHCPKCGTVRDWSCPNCGDERPLN